AGCSRSAACWSRRPACSRSCTAGGGPSWPRGTSARPRPRRRPARGRTRPPRPPPPATRGPPPTGARARRRRPEGAPNPSTRQNDATPQGRPAERTTMSHAEQSPHEDGNSVAAWTAVSIITLGFLVGGVAVWLASPVGFYVGVGLCVLGVVVGKVLA